MWILLVLSISYSGHTSQSQIAVEFNTKAACVAAATEWQKRTKTSVRESFVLCTPKGN